MIHVYFEKTGKDINDFTFEDELEILALRYKFSHLLAEPSTDVSDFDVRVCDHLGILMIQIAVVRGLVHHDDVVIYFTDDSGKSWMMHPTKEGAIDHWPKGFASKSDELLVEIIDFRYPQ